MPDRHDKFVHNENLKNFEKQLETETDAVRRELLITLLRAEETKGRIKKQD